MYYSQEASGWKWNKGIGSSVLESMNERTYPKIQRVMMYERKDSLVLSSIGKGFLVGVGVSSVTSIF